MFPCLVMFDQSICWTEIHAKKTHCFSRWITMRKIPFPTCNRMDPICMKDLMGNWNHGKNGRPGWRIIFGWSSTGPSVAWNNFTTWTVSYFEYVYWQDWLEQINMYSINAIKQNPRQCPRWSYPSCPKQEVQFLGDIKAAFSSSTYIARSCVRSCKLVHTIWG